MNMRNITLSSWGSVARRILIVEDDLIMKPILEEVVFRACMGQSIVLRWAYSKEGADELITKTEKEGYAFDLVISDLILSGEENGLNLWQKIQGKCPFLLISGCKDKQIQKLADQLKLKMPHLLHKPLNIEKTAILIRSLLDSPAHI